MSEITLVTKDNEGTDVPDLTQPDEFSDVTLVVEERKLYTYKSVLVSASPVWRRMFSSDFKERNISEIPLPGKNFDDVLELLLCITPATQKEITGDTVFRILPLAEEYQMQRLKKHCEQYLRQQLGGGKLSDDDKVKYANLAQTYSLEKLLDESTKSMCTLSLDALEKCEEYPDIVPDTMVRILKSRLLEQDSKLRRLRDEVTCQRCGYSNCSFTGKCSGYKLVLSHTLLRELVSDL